MTLHITCSGQACGAEVSGVDLGMALAAEDVLRIRAAWLQYHVLAFPQQTMSNGDLLRFTRYFGGFGDDPFIASIPGQEHIIAVERRANEQAPLFAENWHTDWSFQAVPPAGTCLLSITVPPQGGDTLFANQHKALTEMPAALREKLEGKIAIHSAKAAYSPEGMYGQEDQATDRSMVIRPSAEALATQRHPLIRLHPETGEAGVFGCLGYIVGIEGMDDDAAFALLLELLEWQTQPEFVYQHRWQPDMLIMWDNRSLLHKATGGYEAYDRLLHRTTIAQ